MTRPDRSVAWRISGSEALADAARAIGPTLSAVVDRAVAVRRAPPAREGLAFFEAERRLAMVTVWLTSGALGDASEADYEAWVRWMAANVGTLPGLGGVEVAVEAYPYGTAGDDSVSGGDAETRASVRAWLAVDGWEAFCSDPAAWPAAA